jgi:putative ABC transport system permease protein
VSLSALRPALRNLSRRQAFAATSIATLALGLGANIAVLSASYGVLVKPLPYRDAARLLVVRAEALYEGSSQPTSVSVQRDDVESWARSAVNLRNSAFYAEAASALIGDQGSEILTTAVVSSNFFDEMDGPLIAGRPLLSEDDREPVVVISERLARRLFGSVESAIGRSITLKPHVYAIVGVAGRSFDFPRDQVDAWVPKGFSQATDPSCCSFGVIARLASGVTVEAAGEEAKTLFNGLASSVRGGSTLRVRALPLTEERVASVRPALLILSAATGLLLFIACGNVVNLSLARNTEREMEFAIRRALGAPASSLIAQLALEGAVLAVAAAATGLLFAFILLRLMARLSEGAVPGLETIELDSMSLVIGVGLAALTTIGTTILPALRVIQSSALPLRSWERGGRGAGIRALLRGMSAAQVAMAIVLLVGATVMNRGLLKLLAVDLGVTREHVVTASINVAFGESLDDAASLVRIDRLLESVAATPGVRAAGVGAAVPPHLARMQVTLRRGAEVDYRAAAVPATPGYLSALELRLREGRFFNDLDSEDAPPVMMMTEQTARRFFGDRALGRTMSVPRLRNGKVSSVETTLVGIVQNVRYAGLAASPDDVIYVPFHQQPWKSAFLVVRTDRAPEALVENVRRVIAKAEPAIVVGEVATLDQLISGQAGGARFRTVLLSVIATLALGIAAVGLYGMVSYSVSRRTRELGVRVALGATARDVIAMILRETLSIGGIGLAIGLGIAAYAVNLLSGQVYGLETTDPASFAGASLGLLLVMAVAGYFPARRASRMEPLDALRTE